VLVTEETGRLLRWQERHRRLIARLMLTLFLTVVVAVLGALAMWLLERNAPQTEIHGYGDALFFTTVQLLTVSSQLKNPVTTWGRVIDIGFELWALFVVTAVAGSFSSFFASGDSQ
jgi:hypothetical protein